MRTPDAGRVMGVRTLAVWCLRAASTLLVAVGMYLILKRVFFGVGVSDFTMVHRVYQGVGEDNSLYRGLAMVAVGAGLGLASARIARWMVPVPARGCPGCGYAAADDAGKCPECGLELAGKPF